MQFMKKKQDFGFSSKHILQGGTTHLCFHKWVMFYDMMIGFLNNSNSWAAKKIVVLMIRD